MRKLHAEAATALPGAGAIVEDGERTVGDAERRDGFRARRTLDALERTAFAAVTVTAKALVDSAGPELTFLGWRTIVVLDESTDPMRLSDLAERLRLSRPSASKLVRRLERRGLIELAPNPRDGRGLLLTLSAQGHQVRDAVIGRRREILAESLCPPLPERFDEALVVVADRLARAI